MSASTRRFTRARLGTAATAAWALLAAFAELCVGPANVVAADQAPAAVIAPPAQPTVPTGTVTYLTTTSAYIDLGRAEGLQVSDRLEVVRDTLTIGSLVVTFISSHKASCAIQQGSAALQVGDRVRRAAIAASTVAASDSAGLRQITPATAASGSGSAFAPAAGGASASAGAGTTAAVQTLPRRPRAASWLAAQGLRGHIGVRYLGVQNRDADSGDLSQPAGDLRVDGTRVGGSPLDVSVDVRARHTFQTDPNGSTFHTEEARVYRLGATWWLPDPRLHLSVGRQFASSLSSVSTFDGAELEFNTSRWGVGVFAGTQPEPIDYGLSNDIHEYGLFARLRSTADPVLPGRPLGAGRLRWELATAAIGSYDHGEINREYVSMQGRLDTSALSLMASQDLDLNRGWKLDAGEPHYSFTNTFLSARARPGRHLDLDAGFDNRRNVRLYRDHVTPETEFDDTYRQGVWGGAAVRVGDHVRIGGNVRDSSGGSAGQSRAYSGNLALSRLTPLFLDLHLRSTRYESSFTQGWMHTAALGVRPQQQWSVEINGGLRDDLGTVEAAVASRAQWLGVDLDLGLSQHWFLLLSVERDRREGVTTERFDQYYATVSFRF